jgi:hypothetical protein
MAGQRSAKLTVPCAWSDPAWVTSAWPRRRLQRSCLNNVRSASVEREGIGKSKMPQARLQSESRTRGEAVQKCYPSSSHRAPNFPRYLSVESLPKPADRDRTPLTPPGSLCLRGRALLAKHRHHPPPIRVAEHTPHPIHFLRVNNQIYRDCNGVCKRQKALAARCCSPSLPQICARQPPCFLTPRRTRSTRFRT